MVRAFVACLPRARARKDAWIAKTNSATSFFRPSSLLLYSACAWIASKFEDRAPPSVEDFVYISDHSFTTNALRVIESRVCEELGFRLHRVTPYHFVNLFLRASHACPCRACQFDHPILRNLVCYLLELSRLSYKLSKRRPSLLTAACVYLARATLGIRERNPLHAVDQAGFWTKTLQHYTGYSVEQLKSTVVAIHEYQSTAEGSVHMRGMFVKYGRSDRDSVSLKTALRKEDLGWDL